MSDVPIKRKPGRPKKVVVPATETPTAAVVPIPEPRENTNPLVVEERLGGELMALHDDPGEEVELPDDDAPNALKVGETVHADVSEDAGVAAVFADAGGVGADRVAEASAVEGEVDAHEEVAAAGVPVDEDVRALSADQIRALDRDFDGRAGGSRPEASLSPLQVKAFTQDVVDAYEGQWEIKRVDAHNRVWTFRHEVVKNQDNMLVRVARGPSVAERLISTAFFSQGHAMVAIEEIDAETRR